VGFVPKGQTVRQVQIPLSDCYKVMQGGGNPRSVKYQHCGFRNYNVEVAMNPSMKENFA